MLDALHIEAADEKELAIRKEQVKAYIVASRAGYFSKDRLGRSCGLILVDKSSHQQRHSDTRELRCSERSRVPGDQP